MKWKKYFKDPEFLFILLYNLLIIYLYLNSNYDKNLAIWGFYLQSVFIGLQYVLISTIKKIKSSGSFFPLSQHSFTGFFIIHFGLFHFVYFVFLLSMFVTREPENIDVLTQFIETSFILLVINTLVVSGREILSSTEDYPPPSIFAAYARIVPIHILIIVAGFQKDRMAIAFLVFMVLKILIDIFIYMITSPSDIDKR